MHTDEAVNAYVVGQLLTGDSFHYDPQDRHGPALALVALSLARMQGARSFAELTESQLRLTAVLGGTLTIFLFGAAVELFGFVPCIVAALLSAIAPLPVYYDRYFIHESLFCGSTFALILSGWYAVKTRIIGYAVLAGACAALMFACKETSVLHWFALAAAGLLFWVRDLRSKRSPIKSRLAPLSAALGTCLALAILLYTWFGTNWKNLAALTKLAPDLLSRAAGQGHEKPFWYFAKLLSGGWSGGVLLALAFVGITITIRKRDNSPYPCLAYYALIIAAIYSSIPYKTPWLALNIWLPLSLFIARAAQYLWQCMATPLGRRAAWSAATVLFASLGVLIAHDTRQRAFLHAADETNPYAYAHTLDDILGLPAEIRDLSRQHGIATPRIAVIASDPWPLPWYLRHFEQVGFYQPGQQVPSGDFYITSTEASEQYAEQLRNLRPDFFGVRPNVLVLLWSPEAR